MGASVSVDVVFQLTMPRSNTSKVWPKHVLVLDNQSTHVRTHEIHANKTHNTHLRPDMICMKMALASFSGIVFCLFSLCESTTCMGNVVISYVCVL